jgi:hypothetical protein
LSAIQFLVLVQRALMEGRAIMEPLCTGDSIWPLLSVGQSGGKKIKKIKKKKNLSVPLPEFRCPGIFLGILGGDSKCFQPMIRENRQLVTDKPVEFEK